MYRPFSFVSARVLILLVPLGLLIGGCRPSEEHSRPSQPAATVAPEKITTKLGVEMVHLPAGEFLMGNDEGEDDETPAHSVRLGAFYIDVCEVTQEDYLKLTGKSPSKFKGAQRPVDQVSWLDAIQYCNMRSLREGFKPCYNPATLACDFTADGYRLPSEAEWEYACRAGTATRWSFGDSAAKLAEHAWFKANADKTTHPVKEKAANPWGLYDMHGNVSEWCNDFYAEGYDPQDPGQDPCGPDSGEMRVVRGGCWATSDESCRSSARGSESPGFVDVCFKREAYGFRCVRKSDKTAAESPAGKQQPD